MAQKQKMDKWQLEELLAEAQDHMRDAIDLLKDYVAATGDTNAKAYMLDHLIIMTSADHNFLSRDLNMDDLIERVREEYGDEEE